METKPRREDTGRGFTIVWGDRYLYSRRAPDVLPRRVGLEHPLQENTLYLCPSPLLAYGFEELLQRLPEGSHLLALEADQELMALTAPLVPPELLEDQRISWIRAEEPLALHALLETLGPWRFRRIQRIDLSGGAALHASLYQELTAFLRKDLARYWQNRHTLFQLGRSWVRRLLANLADTPKARPLESLQIRGTIAVAGAGESLEAALPLLKKYRRKLWLLAVDTALNALEEYGLHPDAVFVLETQSWNLLDFHGTQGSGIPVIGDLTSYPPSLTVTGGDQYFYATSFAPCRLWERLTQGGILPLLFPPLGSVGVGAAQAALCLSSGQVLLTGLDFSYRLGKSHARGTAPQRWLLAGGHRLNVGGDWKTAMNRPLERVRGSQGGEVLSDAVLTGYASRIKEDLPSLGRTAVLAPGGVDLGLPVWGEGELRECLAQAPEIEVIRSKEFWSSQKRADFIAGEKRLLNQVVQAWENYAAGREGTAPLLEALTAVDHVYIDFPDPPPLPREDINFLTRAVNRTRSLLDYLERLGVQGRG